MRTIALPPAIPRLLPDADEMRAWDNETIAAGTSAEVLMERAGNGVAHEVLAQITPRAQAVVLCGPGNNGGDGLVVSRVLREHHVACRTFVVASTKHSPEFLSHAKSTGDVEYIGARHPGYPADWKEGTWPSIRTALESAQIVVDAILGVGQSRDVSGDLLALVNLFNSVRDHSDCKVVAVDTPTGVDTNTGQIFQHCIRADVTVCIEMVKRGLLQFPGCEMAGSICVARIGISGSSRVLFSLLDDESVPRLAKRKAVSHKGNYGHVLVVGGSAAFPGAPELTSRAALRTGAALVTRCSPAQTWGTAITPEIMRLPASASDVFTSTDVTSVLEAAEKCTSVALGPGLGQRGETIAFVLALLEGLQQKKIPVVVDADAINAVSAEKAFSNLRGTLITPHPGEAARLLDVTVADLMKDRYSAAVELERITGATVILKGAGTIVWAEGAGYVSDSANPYMATGGSGDVLTGILAGLLANRLSMSDSARLGVLSHARAAEKAVQQSGGTIIASDIIDCLPAIIGRFTGE